LVERWRRAQALRRTVERRPDLRSPESLTEAEAALLREFPADGPAS
jgi:tRNA G37 N-methylase TrmD